MKKMESCCETSEIGNIDIKKWLTENHKETLEKVLKTFGKTQKQFDDDVLSIQDWMKTQHHLPEIGKEGLIKNFLLVNKCSIPKAKEKLDMYYTIRHMMPEVFNNSNISFPQMKAVADQIYFFPLPKRTEEGSRVSICKMVDICPDNFDFNKFLAYGCNSLEVRFDEDLLYEEILVLDLENAKLQHVFKVSPFCLKKIVIIGEKVFSNRIKKAYLINCPSYAVNTINLLKQLINSKIASRICVEAGTETLLKEIPLKILPKDYGGLESSLEDINEMWKLKLEEHKDRFQILETLRTNENLRPVPLKNDEILGYHGNFRQLSFD